MNVEQVMTLAPVIPVLVVHDVRHARPIAEALVAGGLPALEVTLRTDCALDVIREMAKVEGAVVGAGTVLNPDDVKASVDAGARFLVSPGLTEPLANAAIAAQLPFLPGTANAGDIMRGLDMGLTHFKFFPATANGGIPALKALAAPLYKARFCPTGGITEATAVDWLALDAVLCVGGSWVVPAGEPDPVEIERRARAAVALAAR
ncbi:2-dehydro-3-deoxyphosphogluconate aldolase [Sphingomonas sp. Root710]|uniref:bifunctional 4-hydroxy-2-oxoglutarate aldolase/2-dehydro-3-deoxy-phosphogluconate aldolase n=1 Tax=Sphingomonas sp. Root710 TaxID=1736594 RepID=UPI0006F5A802|nr:bifunctional 4-hydroxy-2-oxoglutarate aldolase/2-dehydro-3-deoxy-phosphogluconate aldolase [Sphingomonas sp. Root710]KRB80741.1 2-dehydro-3-deoxyphosphogluconate aldolase [Sphingomonas sp. Root710]